MLSNMILIPQGKRLSKCWKPAFYGSIQLIQPNLYATIGLSDTHLINFIICTLEFEIHLNFACLPVGRSFDI